MRFSETRIGVWTAKLADGNTITKTRMSATRRGESGYAEFKCTCGWQARTSTGVRNDYAVMHARDEHGST